MLLYVLDSVQYRDWAKILGELAWSRAQCNADGTALTDLTGREIVNAIVFAHRPDLPRRRKLDVLVRALGRHGLIVIAFSGGNSLPDWNDLWSEEFYVLKSPMGNADRGFGVRVERFLSAQGVTQERQFGVLEAPTQVHRDVIDAGLVHNWLDKLNLGTWESERLPLFPPMLEGVEERIEQFWHELGRRLSKSVRERVHASMQEAKSATTAFLAAVDGLHAAWHCVGAERAVAFALVQRARSTLLEQMKKLSRAIEKHANE